MSNDASPGLCHCHLWPAEVHPPAQAPQHREGQKSAAQRQGHSERAEPVERLARWVSLACQPDATSPCSVGVPGSGRFRQRNRFWVVGREQNVKVCQRKLRRALGPQRSRTVGRDPFRDLQRRVLVHKTRREFPRWLDHLRRDWGGDRWRQAFFFPSPWSTGLHGSWPGYAEARSVQKLKPWQLQSTAWSGPKRCLPWWSGQLFDQTMKKWCAGWAIHPASLTQELSSMPSKSKAPGMEFAEKRIAIEIKMACEHMAAAGGVLKWCNSHQ